MPDAQCGICGQSFDGASDHALCRAATLAAILGYILKQNLTVPAPSTGTERAARFEAGVGQKPDDRKWYGFVTITMPEGIREYETGPWETTEEAGAAIDNLYENFVEYVRLRGGDSARFIDIPGQGKDGN